MGREPFSGAAWLLVNREEIEELPPTEVTVAEARGIACVDIDRDVAPWTVRLTDGPSYAAFEVDPRVPSWWAEAAVQAGIRRAMRFMPTRRTEDANRD